MTFPRLRIALLAALAITIAFSAPAQAHNRTNFVDAAAIPAYPTSNYVRVPRGRPHAARQARTHRAATVRRHHEARQASHAIRRSPVRYSRSIQRQPASSRTGVVFIPNPAGTWRIFASCAHRLAAYWGLGHGLDKVSTWPEVFRRASGPGVGIAAVRRDQHHIMGIIGGVPGAWRVADFNSGGHRNREYTVSDFHRYFFVDPHSRMASR